MQENSTPDHFIAYLYNETTSSESRLIQETLNQDLAFRKDFEVLQTVKRQLPKAKFNAAPITLQRILKYSKTSAVTI